MHRGSAANVSSRLLMERADLATRHVAIGVTHAALELVQLRALGAVHRSAGAVMPGWQRSEFALKSLKL
jgi:hypothetical protein